MRNPFFNKIHPLHFFKILLKASCIRTKYKRIKKTYRHTEILWVRFQTTATKGTSQQSKSKELLASQCIYKLYLQCSALSAAAALCYKKNKCIPYSSNGDIESSFRSFPNILQKNLNELFGQQDLIAKKC